MQDGCRIAAAAAQACLFWDGFLNLDVEGPALGHWGVFEECFTGLDGEVFVGWDVRQIATALQFKGVVCSFGQAELDVVAQIDGAEDAFEVVVPIGSLAHNVQK